MKHEGIRISSRSRFSILLSVMTLGKAKNSGRQFNENC